MSNGLRKFLFHLLYALLAPLAPLGAQEAIPTLAETGQPPAEVIVLGVFPFHNPNADYAQFEGIDVLAPERQREIEAVVVALEDFIRLHDNDGETDAHLPFGKGLEVWPLLVAALDALPRDPMVVLGSDELECNRGSLSTWRRMAGEAIPTE